MLNKIEELKQGTEDNTWTKGRSNWR